MTDAEKLEFLKLKARLGEAEAEAEVRAIERGEGLKQWSPELNQYYHGYYTAEAKAYKKVLSDLGEPVRWDIRK